MRRRGKIDTNQNEIVTALRAAGASVQSLASVGDGCPDLAVGFHGQTYLVECKAGRGHLTTDQYEWIGRWGGHVTVVRNVDEALGVIGVRRGQ